MATRNTLMPLWRRAAGARGGLIYLYLDEWITDDAAPIATPRTAEPGPGTATLVQTDGTQAISGGKHVFTAQATPTWGDQGFHCSAQTRDSGLALVNTINLTTWEECGVGWHAAAAVVDPDSAEHAIQANATDGRFDDENATPIITGLSTSTDYKIAQVLRSVGCHYILDGELLWVDDAGATATLYPMFSNLDGAGSSDNFLVTDLPANGYTEWDADFSTVTDSEINQASKNYDCEADCHVTGTFTCENTKYVYIYIRYTDANNWVRLAIGTDRVVKLEKNVATSVSAVATGSTLTDAVEYKYDLVAYGSAVEGFINNVSDVDGTITDHSSVAQGRLEHDLATNDLDVTSHPYPALGIATDRVIAPQDSQEFSSDIGPDGVFYWRSITLEPVATSITYVRGTNSTTSPYGYSVHFRASGELRLRDDQAGANRIVAAGAVSDGDDVCLVLDGTDAELFVNGVSVGSYASATYLTNTGAKHYSVGPICDSIEFFPRDVSSLLPSDLV